MSKEEFKFEELSEEAKEKAIKDWRENGYEWDSFEVEQLTESFKEVLKEKGFEDDVEVNWGLSYCQGDGVCFSGRLELARFLDQEGFRKYKEMAPYLYVKVKNARGNYCHWNSMDVEVELEGVRTEDLLSSDLKDEYADVSYKNSSMIRKWQEEKHAVLDQKYYDVKQWESRTSRYPKAPLFWHPDMAEKPEPLDIPIPEEPEQIEPSARLKRALETAQRKLDRMEAKLPLLEADVKEWVEDTSRELEKMGYEEIEYRSSDEVISDTLIANEYEFSEEGERL